MPLWRRSYEEQFKVGTQLKSSLLHSIRYQTCRKLGWTALPRCPNRSLKKQYANESEIFTLGQLCLPNTRALYPNACFLSSLILCVCVCVWYLQLCVCVQQLFLLHIQLYFPTWQPLATCGYLNLNTVNSALMLVLKNANLFQSNDISGNNFSMIDFMFMCNLERRKHR